MTEYFEIYIIKMPKAIQEYQRNRKNKMLQWVMFLDNPEKEEVFKIMEENENIKVVKKEIEKLKEQN